MSLLGDIVSLCIAFNLGVILTDKHNCADLTHWSAQLCLSVKYNALLKSSKYVRASRSRHRSDTYIFWHSEDRAS